MALKLLVAPVQVRLNHSFAMKIHRWVQRDLARRPVDPRLIWLQQDAGLDVSTMPAGPLL